MKAKRPLTPINDVPEDGTSRNGGQEANNGKDDVAIDVAGKKSEWI